MDCSLWGIIVTRAKTVFVTGAMGQLGKRVVQALLGKGHTVVASDMRTEATVAAAAGLESAAAGSSGKLLVQYVNLLEVPALRAVVVEHQPEVIIHLAAIVSPPCYRNPGLARQVNVEGTRNVVDAAKALRVPPTIIEASSSAVYGSRNPHRYPERITPLTSVNPVECYGEDKVAAERIVAESGLPHATMRLGGIISPDAMSIVTSDYLLLARATPRDNRVHAVDARDAALAFANAAELGPAVNSKIFLIGGNDSYVLLHGQIQDDATEALGIGRIGDSTGLPGDPDDDRGWGLTDWFDTTEAEHLLQFQKHNWVETLAWLGEGHGERRKLMRLIGPVLLPVLRAVNLFQRVIDRRGRYANPWALISKKYGREILASTWR